jgi:hypothetical protein
LTLSEGFRAVSYGDEYKVFEVGNRSGTVHGCLLGNRIQQLGE